MKTEIRIFAFLAILAVMGSACTREEAVTPSANFKLTAANNNVYAGENFTIILKGVKGDFVTLYAGDKASNSYDPFNPKGKGTVLEPGQDSMSMAYLNAGKYPLTIVASSVGNWGEDYLSAVKTDTVYVNDRRADFLRISIDKVEGKFNEDRTEIYFYATRNLDLTAKAPMFFTTSSAATVFIGDSQQVSGTSLVDFSAITPGDPEGRPVVYTIKAMNGDTRTYTVKYILRDPYTEKVLNSVTFSTLGTTVYPDEAAKTVEVIYLQDTKITAVKTKATASIGAAVTIGTKNISDKENSVDLGSASKITVTAEDGTVQDYALIKTVVEKIATFNLTKANGTALYPKLAGTIDYTTKTIRVKTLLVPALKTKLVAEFTGLTLYSVKVGTTSVTSGVTEINCSAPVTLDLYKAGRKLDSYTLIVE
ncbi:MAG: hypothetical protein U0T82_09905 [Bacteroidales bacterium]